jgi:hypothetical protein
MLLIDLNQVVLSGLLVQISPKDVLNEDLIRHIVLNTLRNNIKKFKEYNEVIICCDSRNYWRKKYYKHYKSHRKEIREKSALDWNLIFKTLNQIKQDLREYFPYKVVEVDGAEADDVIAVLTSRHSMSESVLILSSDSDYKQLHQYKNVKQYNPTLGVYVKSHDPVSELTEKVIKGDRGDNIPNILSNDDVFLTKTRQKPITAKLLQSLLNGSVESQLTEEQLLNYKRNRILIDFNFIPLDIKTNIIAEYENVTPSPRKNIYKYMVKNKLSMLLEHIGDF